MRHSKRFLSHKIHWKLKQLYHSFAVQTDAIGEMRISSHIPPECKPEAQWPVTGKKNQTHFRWGLSAVRALQAGLTLQVMLASVHTLLPSHQFTANIWQPLAPGQIHLHWWLRRTALMFLTKLNKTEKQNKTKLLLQTQKKLCARYSVKTYRTRKHPLRRNPYKE